MQRLKITGRKRYGDCKLRAVAAVHRECHFARRRHQREDGCDILPALRTCFGELHRAKAGDYRVVRRAVEIACLAAFYLERRIGVGKRAHARVCFAVCKRRTVQIAVAYRRTHMLRGIHAHPLAGRRDFRTVAACARFYIVHVGVVERVFQKAAPRNLFSGHCGTVHYAERAAEPVAGILRAVAVVYGDFHAAAIAHNSARLIRAGLLNIARNARQIVRRAAYGDGFELTVDIARVIPTLQPAAIQPADQTARRIGCVYRACVVTVSNRSGGRALHAHIARNPAGGAAGARALAVNFVTRLNFAA